MSAALNRSDDHQFRPTQSRVDYYSGMNSGSNALSVAPEWMEMPEPEDQVGQFVDPRQKVVPITPPSRESSPVVRPFPRSRPLPLWLKVLMVAQKGSLVVAFGMTAAALSVYSWTVYTQRTWSQTYHHLEQLQQDQRQLTMIGAVLEDRIVRQSENSDSGLVLPTSEHTIFLTPTSVPSQPTDLSVNPMTVEPATSQRPMGY